MKTKKFKNSYHVITYIKGTKTLESEEVTNIKQKYIMNNHVRRYEGALVVIAQLSTTARHYFDFLTDVMTVGNVFFSDEETFDNYNRFRVKAGIEPITYNSVRRTIKEMVDLGLIIKLQKARYLVNPHYFFKGEEKNRGTMIAKGMMYNDKEIIIRRIELKEIKNENIGQHSELHS